MHNQTPYLNNFLKKFFNLFLLVAAIIAPYLQLEEQEEKSFLSIVQCQYSITKPQMKTQLPTEK